MLRPDRHRPGLRRTGPRQKQLAHRHLSVSQAILGVFPDYDGLRVRPCVPESWQEYTVFRKFRGCRYTIHVRRTGVRSLSVDGKALTGDLVPISMKNECAVEVTL